MSPPRYRVMSGGLEPPGDSASTGGACMRTAAGTVTGWWSGSSVSVRVAGGTAPPFGRRTCGACYPPCLPRRQPTPPVRCWRPECRSVTPRSGGKAEGRRRRLPWLWVGEWVLNEVQRANGGSQRGRRSPFKHSLCPSYWIHSIHPMYLPNCHRTKPHNHALVNRAYIYV